MPITRRKSFFRFVSARTINIRKTQGHKEKFLQKMSKICSRAGNTGERYGQMGVSMRTWDYTRDILNTNGHKCSEREGLAIWGEARPDGTLY